MTKGTGKMSRQANQAKKRNRSIRPSTMSSWKSKKMQPPNKSKKLLGKEHLKNTLTKEETLIDLNN